MTYWAICSSTEKGRCSEAGNAGHPLSCWGCTQKSRDGLPVVVFFGDNAEMPSLVRIIDAMRDEWDTRSDGRWGGGCAVTRCPGSSCYTVFML